LDVTQDADWVISLGNSFAKQYILYAPDDDHAALLHRCIGILLQKVNDRAYVRDKIDWMYEQADISIPANRLGLAKAMGLVAASHLDTVLEKLKIIVDNVGQSIFQRFILLDLLKSSPHILSNVKNLVMPAYLSLIVEPISLFLSFRS
jgi:hypothetical protein